MACLCTMNTNVLSVVCVLSLFVQQSLTRCLLLPLVTALISLVSVCLCASRLCLSLLPACRSACVLSSLPHSSFFVEHNTHTTTIYPLPVTSPLLPPSLLSSMCDLVHRQQLPLCKVQEQGRVRQQPAPPLRREPYL